MRAIYLSLFVLTIAAGGYIAGMMTPLAQAQEERTVGNKTGDKPVSPDENDTYKQLGLFGDVFERVRGQYVDPVTDKQLVEHALNGMLTSLDPHSSYLNEEDFADMQVQTRGSFGGLGIEVTMENGFVKVVSPIDDTPAYKAGVKAGDFITALDGEAVMGLTLNDAVDKMRGKVGTDIKITISREGLDEPLDIVIKRDIIKVTSIKSRIENDDVGYIRITSFNQNTEDSLKKAIQEIKEKGGQKLIGYVIDLRNNPGGLLDQAITVSDAFLDKGEIVSTRGRNEQDTKRDNATPGDITDGKPIVVLINGGSASASEIVAGALQDHKRAIILGTKSFGKGSVQTIIPVPGNGAMRLTTARYYTPSGRSIQAKGIEPDIIVEPAKLEQIAGGQRIYESDLKGALDKNKNVTIPVPAPEKTEEKDKEGKEKEEPIVTTPPSPDDKEQDYQLLRAVDLLRGLSLYEGRYGYPASATLPVATTPPAQAPVTTP